MQDTSSCLGVSFGNSVVLDKMSHSRRAALFDLVLRALRKNVMVLILLWVLAHSISFEPRLREHDVRILCEAFLT